MLRRLGPALGRQAGRLVQHECARIAVDHHVAHQLYFFLGQRLALALGPAGSRRRLVSRGNAYRLPRLDPIAWRGLLAIDPELSCSRPARNDIEADVRHVPLEPAVQSDSVVILADGEGSGFGHAPRPNSPYRSAQYSNACFCSLRISFAALGPSHGPVWPCF